MSCVDQFQIQDLSSNHSYRTELPNIIFDLGITPIALTLYTYYKRVAGDRGACWQSWKNICEKLSMSENALRKYRDELIKPIKALGNRPLIQIQKRKSDSGSQLTDLIIINDIWPENYLNYLKSRKNTPPSESIDPPPQNLRYPPSESEVKEDLIEEEYKQELLLTCTSTVPSPKVEESAAPPVAVFSCLKNLEISDSDKEWITQHHTEEEVKNAVAFCTHPLTKLSKNLEAALKWACKAKPEIPVDRTEMASNAKTWAKSKEGSYKNNMGVVVKLEALSESMEIIALGSQGKPASFEYTRHDFKEAVCKWMKDRNY